MKRLLTCLILVLIFTTGFSQSKSYSDSLLYRVVKNDGTEFIGHIKEKNPDGVLIKTLDKGEIRVPSHTVKEIEEVPASAYDSEGNYVGRNVFSTRYFISTNALPIEKGEHYIQWNLFGPDFEFAVNDNFGVGVMTTWIGSPLIGTAKYTFDLGGKVRGGLGLIAGSTTWIESRIFGGIPFGTLSIGNRKNNLAISGGYGIVAKTLPARVQGRPLLSMGGMFKVSDEISLVFDSFFAPPGAQKFVESSELPTGDIQPFAFGSPESVVLFIPGIRWNQSPDKSFQVGFGGGVSGDNVFPIPMVQWFRKL